MVKTTANTFEYSRLLLAFESKAPMLPVGLQITSAATPDFQAKPRPVITDSRKKGIIVGILMFLIISVLLIPITRAISIRRLSTDKSPVSTCNQMMGKTIRKDMKEGIIEEGIQSQAKMIKAATGTERISLEMGAVRVLKIGLLPESKPHKSPKTTARINPLKMCKRELPTASQKEGSLTQFKNSFKVSSGSGILKRSFVFAILPKICQSRIHIKMDPALSEIFLKLFFIIETVCR